MTATVLPFSDWTQEQCEFLMEILGKKVLTNTALNRLLIPREFTLIKADDEDVREYYFEEAKDCCQKQFTEFVSEGARLLKRMSIEERAQKVMVHKYRFQAFLVDIAHCLEIYPGNEAAFSKLDLRLTLGVGKQKGICAVFDRVACWMIRGLFCSRADVMVITREHELRIYFDQYLEEELEILETLDEKDLIDGGPGARIRRGLNTWRYMAGEPKNSRLL